VRVGQHVSVVQKADQRSGQLTSGTVARLLTNSADHPRGIKVQLADGTVGRVHAAGSGRATATSDMRHAATPARSSRTSSSPLPSSGAALSASSFFASSTPTRYASARPASRSFHSSSCVSHNSTAIPGGAEVHVTFVTPEGERVEVTGVEGENLLALAHAKGVELEGACEASLACSTCHVILPDEYYAKLEAPCDEENDMLDLAFGLTDTSRLGCQVKLSKDLEGCTVTLPSATRNMAVDGHKPKPH